MENDWLIPKEKRSEIIEELAIIIKPYCSDLPNGYISWGMHSYTPKIKEEVWDTLPEIIQKKILRILESLKPQ